MYEVFFIALQKKKSYLFRILEVLKGRMPFKTSSVASKKNVFLINNWANYNWADVLLVSGKVLLLL